MRTLSLDQEWPRPAHGDLATAITEHRRLVLAGWEVRTRSIERALHDGAQQELLGVRLALLQAAGATTASDVGPLLGRLEAVIDELERLATGRGPRTAQAGDLRSVLLAVARTDLLAVTVDAPSDLSLPGPVIELLAFLASECIVNAVTHGHARRCWIQVTVQGDGVAISLRDDGHGGAQLRRGGGLEGLGQRVVALGGHLWIDPAPEGAGITAALPLVVPTPDDDGPPSARPACAAQVALGEELDDPATRVWFWCADAGYYDETGRPAPATDRMEDLVRVDVAGQRAALIRTSRPIERLAVALRHRRDAVAGGWGPAAAAAANAQLEAERARIDRRMRAAESLMVRRLTERAVGQLRAAHTAIAASSPTAAACREAALGVEAATETVRRIVRRLRASPAEVIADEAPLSEVIAAIARRLGVDPTLSVGDLPDIGLLPAVEQVAEQLLHLVDAKPNGRLSIRHRRGATILKCTCGDLPDPASVALLEDVVAQWGGQVSVGRVDGSVTVQARLGSR